LVKNKDDESKIIEGKKLNSDLKSNNVEADDKKAEAIYSPKTIVVAASDFLPKSRENVHQNSMVNEAVKDDKEKSLQKTGAQGEKEDNGLNSFKNARKSTFKRRERVRNNEHQKNFKSELKKRNADLMEIDSEFELSKKARLEARKADGVDLKERNKSETMNAGLQEQPGESK
jgi:hypothetical protein